MSSRFTRAVAASLLSIALTACGGGVTMPTAATPAPETIKALTFLFVPAAGRDPTVASTNEAIESALIAAGYSVTTNASDPHDASIFVAGSSTEKQSFMTLVVNGKPVHTYEVRVNLTVKDGGTIADQRSVSFDISGEQANTGDGLLVVNDLTDSIRFRTWARKKGASAAPSASSSAP